MFERVVFEIIEVKGGRMVKEWDFEAETFDFKNVLNSMHLFQRLVGESW